MINLTVFGQSNPIIHQLTGGFTFKGEKLDHNTQVFGAKTPSGCGFQFSNDYKYYSFKAGFDMVFAFDLISTKSDFNFLVWKLSSDKQPSAIFDRGGTISADRAVYDKTLTVKGMKEYETDNCEYSNGNGYVNAFQKTEILHKNETVVIAVYGINDTDIFDIKINVGEEREINTFNNLCKGNSYTYQQIYDAVVTDVNTKPNPVANSTIKLYTDNTLSTEVTLGATFSSDTTIYAQVKDASGDTKYIYTIPLKFIPEHQFNFNSIINPIYECTSNYTLNEKGLLRLLFTSGTDLSNYKIKSVNGTPFVDNSQVSLTSGNTTDLKIIVSYIGTCAIDSAEKIIQVIQGTPKLTPIPPDTTCDVNYKINFAAILSKLGYSSSDYDLIVTLTGNPISDGASSPITSTLNYKIKIKSKTAGCESDEIDFFVNKTSEANIIDADVKDYCINDPAFTPTLVGNAINKIQNRNNYTLRYYKADGSEISMDEIYDYMKSNLVGKVIVKALPTDNGNTICETTKELIFKLNKSSFNIPSSIDPLKSTCTIVGAGYTFTKTEIENYLKSKLGSITEFEGIVDETLSGNEFKTINFRVKVNGESCWSETISLKLQVITKPNFTDKTLTTAYCEGDNLLINEALLTYNFGANILNYDLIIDGKSYTSGSSVTKLLAFGTSGNVQIPIEISSNGCSQAVYLNINKKAPLIVPPNFSADIANRKIEFCAADPNSAITQLDQLKKEIKSTYNLQTDISSEDIFKQFTNFNGSVDVEFYDTSKCGKITAQINYIKNEVPVIKLENPKPFCTGTYSTLNFVEIFKDQSFDANDYDVAVSGVREVAPFEYQLKAGKYTVTISKKGVVGCPFVKEITVSEVEPPKIEKISINDKSIIVNATGNGVLKYALYDEFGTLVIDFQTSNELKIPANLTSYNFMVKVIADDCGISDPVNVSYLSLPNVVTPNNDGFNDLWKPMGKGDTKNSYQLIIFDRYGKQLYYKEGVNIIEWDGTLNGKPLPDDTYWYTLKPINESNILQVQYSGSILVKRKTK